MLNETAATLNDQAVRLAQDGDYDDALACFSRAIEIEGSNALLWFNLGLTYRDCGELEKARRALEKAYTINETDEDTIEALAVICLSLDDYEATEFWCAQGLVLNELNPHLWNTLGVVRYNKSDYIVASATFERALTINPYYQEALFNLRDTYSEMGNIVGVNECQRRLDVAKRRTVHR